MKVLVTGGAGFIGRWVVRDLLKRRHQVWVVDNLSNGALANLAEFTGHKNFKAFWKNDFGSEAFLKKIKKYSFDRCVHLAARVVVHDSLLNPADCYRNDVAGVFRLLEFLRAKKIPLVFVSSCMVYDLSRAGQKISETHPVKPASPYAAFKLAGEHMALSYWHSYRLPVTILRPFNTYGPFQKSSGEGGVIAIFVSRSLNRKVLEIYGSGRQTRDFLYVEDCARFICQSGFSSKAVGQVLNAGTGRDYSINQLAQMVIRDPRLIRHVKHIHPQSEIMKLVCNPSRARRLIGWSAQVSFREGLDRTRQWMNGF